VRRPVFALALLLLPLSLVLAQDAVPLHNADFSEVDANALPTGWRVGGTDKQKIAVVPDAGPDGKAALQVEIQTAARGYGEAEQKVAAEPNTGYVVSADMRSSADRLAFVQIKLYKGRKELKRITSRKSDTEWGRVEQSFRSGEADEIGVLCRYIQNKQAVGQTVWFANVALVKSPPPVAKAISATATFEAIGVRVPTSGSPDPRERMPMRYRERGAKSWRDGLPLFFCPTDDEFRGSLVGLKPDTSYEIECWLVKSPQKRLAVSCRTWSEDVPVGEVRPLPVSRTEPLEIRDEGKADGWIVYRPEPGKQATLAVGDQVPYAVLCDGAAYVMIEGLTIRGGNRDAVSIRSSNHIRVRGCDIAHWGDPGTRKDGLRSGLYVDANGRLLNYLAGVRVAAGSTQVVVERNFIHSANGTANSWQYGHPAGPQGVILDRTGGNNVVRYNDIVGSETHWWNDAIESLRNGDVNGGPYQDTDIYGNVLAFSNDDGTELDGGQINVRYHHNWIRWALCGVSHAPNCSGPSYDFRNVIGLGEERLSAGSAFKMGGNQRSPGMNVFLHNTIYGKGGGLRSVGFGSGKDRGAYIGYSRNNLFAGPGGGDITNVSRDPRNDFDYDLASRGGVSLACGGEEHAVTAKPTFVGAAQGDYWLAKGSVGVDQACPLPGFNDDYAGKGPDMGAFESGEATACFPPRPGGMSALPLHTQLRHVTGKDTWQTVTLRVPPDLGTRWTATVNAPWLRCEPSSGNTTAGVQAVRVGPVAELKEERLHRGAVTFRSDQGFTRTVMVDVKVYPANEFTAVFEAEAGALSDGFAKVADAQASGSFYIHAPEATVKTEGVGHEQSEPGTVSFTVHVPQDGIYYLLGRCMVVGPREFAVRHDSFHFAFDNGEKHRWDVGGSPYDQWGWSSAGEQSKGYRPTKIPLKAGTHTLTIHSREPLARLDQVVLTSNPYGEPPQE
jgi:hypothetical protein